MFPVDSLPPQYVEERAAAEAAKQKPATPAEHRGSRSHTPVAPPSQSRQTSPSSGTGSLGQALQQQQRPSLTRTSSSPGVLGNIFQGLMVKAQSPSPTPSTASSLCSTPRAGTPCETSDADALLRAAAAERQRDVDICAMRAW